MGWVFTCNTLLPFACLLPVPACGQLGRTGSCLRIWACRKVEQSGDGLYACLPAWASAWEEDVCLPLYLVGLHFGGRHTNWSFHYATLLATYYLPP